MSTVPFNYSAALTKVIDADTLEVLADLGFYVYKTVILKLARINAPEMSTAEGKESKQLMINLLKDKNVTLSFISIKLNRYGRSIAEVTINTSNLISINLSDYAVKNNFAVYHKY